MKMREMFAEVLELQHQHSSENTPAMERRGLLVRSVIANELRTWPCAKADALLPFRGRVEVQGKDGTGRKTFVPWVRLFCPELSPSPQVGWYVVYLFHVDGTAVSLCVIHGSTRWTGTEFRPRSASEAAELMNWARALLGTQAASLGMVQGVELGSTETLSTAYESTTAFSRTYQAAALPSDDVLMRDAAAAMGLLGELYQALHLGRAPSSTPPEITAAAEAVEEVARPNRKRKVGGQGFGLNAAERSVVEAHAMQRAEEWLASNGYSQVRDVHLTASCDFLAEKGGEDFHIEVKGTTSSFGSILLTANEVELHRAKHPNNVLLVVHNIDLLPLRTQAEGGQIRCFEGWDVEGCTLRPISYQCFLD